MTYREVDNLLLKNSFFEAENILNSLREETADWYFFYGKLLFSKAWFDEARTYFLKANELAPDNTHYRDDLINYMSRHRRYSDEYYRGGYRRHRGCACCCCDDCCCDCNFSCCDLICLDSLCECFGGDLIDCI